MEKQPPRNRIYWTPLLGVEPVEIREDQIIHFTPTRERVCIVCVPTPCKDGWHYAPDFYGLEHYG